MTAPIRNCQTQIIATLGPATSTLEAVRDLILNGADFFRLNFSHGTHESHGKEIAIIRTLEKEFNKDIPIIADLQGPKLRIGSFKKEKDPISLTKGQQIRFDLDPTEGDETRVSFPHADIIAALQPGAQFLMDDGYVAMRVVESGEGYFVAEVESGAKLSSKKGVNVPDLSRPVSSLTDKDKADLEFALSQGVDWIAQSFVQTADDVIEAKKLIGGRAGIIAKIEKPAAIDNFEAILAEVDAIMVARGDLGVEMPFYKVPPLQKYLTHTTRTAGKPVIVATQMMESMRDNPLPTRAEASDVARAVLDGASAVMLSAESAMGKYPTQAVKAMDDICEEMETGKVSLSLQMTKNSYPPVVFGPRKKAVLVKKFPGNKPKI